MTNHKLRPFTQGQKLQPDEKKLLRKPNTDNMGKLFVTVFANRSCYQDKFVVIAKPGLAHLQIC
jgi:hypothetical protein